MLEKYRATIHGNTIEWEGESPEELDREDASIRVELTLVSPRSQPKRSNGRKMVEALEKIAARGELAKAIPDPDKWLREIRKDRPLPGRD